MDETHAAGPADFEREKWQMEVAFRQREVDLKEKEHNRLATEARRSRWWNPLFIAIVGATIAAIGNAAISWLNGIAAQQAEALKGESARILEAIKANDPDKAKENLRFLIAAGLISDPTAGKMQTYLEKQPFGQGPFLPSVSIDLETMRLKRLIDKRSQMTDLMTQLEASGRLSVPEGPYEKTLEFIEILADLPMRCEAYRRNPQLRQEIQRHAGFDTPEMSTAAAKALDCP